MEHIELEEDYGGASGYVVGTDKVQIGNYLSDYSDKAQAVADWFKANCEQVAILKNLNVEEGERGNGYGNELLEGFLAEAGGNGADAVFLISDSGESQAEGFSLDNWYESYDFVAVTPTVSGTLMVHPFEIGLRLRDALLAVDSMDGTKPGQQVTHSPGELD